MTEKPFVDYYDFLQLSPNADLETIERVYRFLAKKCHPDNKDTGNSEKFNNLTEAYRILSNPEKRAAFDANYEEEKNKQWKEVSTISSSEGYETDKQIRHTILSILYIKRRQDSSNSGVGNWQLENIMGWPEKTLEFHIWYLKEKKWIERTDIGGFAITASGVDEIENEGLILRKDRLLSESTESSEDPENIKLIAEENIETEDEYENTMNHLTKKIEVNPNNIFYG
jgi:curved DNA-binding protein